MVVAAKANGDPGRTVDFQKLNKACVRQTHHTESPYHLVSSVPKKVYKTSVDAWNGYHSVLLALEDQKFTTFVTPWGRYRYCVAPQGHLVIGDAFTHWYDEVVKDLEPYFKKCVDDTLIWGQTLEEAFFRTCEYISTCGAAGIVFNRTKLQFGHMELEFLGLNTTADLVSPSNLMLEAIGDFPGQRSSLGSGAGLV